MCLYKKLSSKKNQHKSNKILLEQKVESKELKNGALYIGKFFFARQ